MAYTLPPDFAEFAHQQVAAGAFPSEQALVEAAVRDLRDEREQAIESVQRGIESMERGEGAPAEEVFNASASESRLSFERT
jgi:Arc/MetJ-type ribon-helix-helix transcriptional regulator